MRTIKQNRWGWRGYEAGRFVIEFGTDQMDVEQWRDGKLTPAEEDKWHGRRDSKKKGLKCFSLS